MYVYFAFGEIQGVETIFVKIGRASDPFRRCKQLASGFPVEINIRGLIVCEGEGLSGFVESELHKMFRKYRVAREWHSYHPDMDVFAYPNASPEAFRYITDWQSLIPAQI